MQQIMAQAQKMQRDIEQKKKQIDSMEFIGRSEWFEVKVSGDKKIKKVNILSDEIFNKENCDILTDMLQIAMNKAFTEVEKETNKELGAYANIGGLM